MKRGMDVSEFQGKVQWDKVVTDFVIIRAGYGQKTLDAQFVRNIQECNRLNIPCGVYWFSYALTPEDAAQEAKACLNAVQPYKMCIRDRYGARDVEFLKDGIRMDLAQAYEKETVRKLLRTFHYKQGRLIVSDEFIFDMIPETLAERFVTRGRITQEPGRLIFENGRERAVLHLSLIHI